MINYGKVYSTNLPLEIEVTNDMVFLAKNINAYTKIIEDHAVSGYEYDYIGYTKNEYISLLSQQNQQLQNELLDTQSALCDVYELLEGGIE